MSFKSMSSIGLGVPPPPPPPPRARPPPPPASSASSPDPGDDMGGDEDSKTIPAFLLKTFNMVSDPNTNHIVCWNEKGDGFIVKNEHEFALAVLPVYFRHKNFSSFVRQLNFYGFRKRSNKSSYSQFSHPLFVRGQVEKLRHIKRKTAEANVCTSSSSMKDSLSSLQTQVSELKEQYDHIWKIQHQILYILSQFVRGSPEASAILNNVANPLKRARIGDRTDNGRGAPRRRPLLDGSNPSVPAIDSVPDHNSDDDGGSSSAADEWNSLAQIKEIVDSLPKGANVLQGAAGFPLPARSTSSAPAVSAAPSSSASASSSTAVAARRVGGAGPNAFDVTSKVQRFSVPQLQDLNDGSKLSPFTSNNGHFSLSLNSPPFSTFVEDQDLARFGSASSAGPTGGVSITEVPMDSDALSSRSGPTPDPWFDNAHAAQTAAESILASAGHDLSNWSSSSGPTLTPAQAQSLTAALVQAHAVHAARSRKNSGPLGADTALTMRSPSRPNMPSPGGLSVGSNRWDAPNPLNDLPMPSLGRGSSTTSSLGPIPNIELLDRHDELGHPLSAPLIGPDHFPPSAHDDLDLVPPPPSFLPPSPLSPALPFVPQPATLPQLDPSTAAALALARANSMRRR